MCASADRNPVDPVNCKRAAAGKEESHDLEAQRHRRRGRRARRKIPHRGGARWAAVVYNQPAGHLEAGETLVQAAAREMLEETARPFRPTALVGVYRYESAQNGITYLRFCFAGDCGEREAGRDLDPDIIQSLWLSRDELAQRADQMRSPMVLRCIHDYQAGRRWPLDLLTEIP